MAPLSSMSLELAKIARMLTGTDQPGPECVARCTGFAASCQWSPTVGSMGSSTVDPHGLTLMEETSIKPGDSCRLHIPALLSKVGHHGHVTRGYRSELVDNFGALRLILLVGQDAYVMQTGHFS
jgi:hypothetical protein